MPRQLLGVGTTDFGLYEYEEPELKPDQIRVRSEFTAAKHGTELAGRKGYAAHRGRFDRERGLFEMPQRAAPPAKGTPGGAGNMTVGTITEAGAEVEGLAVGDRVLIHGGFRQTHTRPAKGVWKIPAGLSAASAVCLDPADFAMGAVRDGHIRVGDNVAVFGTGAIGLMAVQLARLAGAAMVIAADPLPTRRALAGRLGADLLLDPTACDAGLELKKATGWRGVDVAIDYSGVVAAMQACLRGVAYGGNVVAGAFPAPYAAGLDLGAESHQYIPNIVFTRSCSEPNRDYPRWDEKRILETCLAWLIDGRLTGEGVVTPVVRFEDLPTEFPKIVTEPDTYIKIGATY
ncbi:MAG TPA: zinc-binding alcohol dehydrogenase [Phycisphaerae bacterium]|nr:zinc-binding alcohol dehydrogenase [Phycisphaerae bacterium]